MMVNEVKSEAKALPLCQDRGSLTGSQCPQLHVGCWLANYMIVVTRIYRHLKTAACIELFFLFCSGKRKSS